MFTSSSLVEAFETLGEVLTDRRQSAEVVVIGGGSLLLLKLIERPTKDLRFGGLILHVAAREDQICFKLYASVDQGPRSKHTQDLRRLHPSSEELARAAAWCKTHDPSEGFAEQLALTLHALGGSDGA